MTKAVIGEIYEYVYPGQEFWQKYYEQLDDSDIYVFTDVFYGCPLYGSPLAGIGALVHGKKSRCVNDLDPIYVWEDLDKFPKIKEWMNANTSKIHNAFDTMHKPYELGEGLLGYSCLYFGVYSDTFEKQLYSLERVSRTSFKMRVNASYPDYDSEFFYCLGLDYEDDCYEYDLAFEFNLCFGDTSIGRLWYIDKNNINLIVYKGLDYKQQMSSNRVSYSKVYTMPITDKKVRETLFKTLKENMDTSILDKFVSDNLNHWEKEGILRDGYIIEYTHNAGEEFTVGKATFVHTAFFDGNKEICLYKDVIKQYCTSDKIDAVLSKFRQQYDIPDDYALSILSPEQAKRLIDYKKDILERGVPYWCNNKLGSHIGYSGVEGTQQFKSNSTLCVLPVLYVPKGEIVVKTAKQDNTPKALKAEKQDNTPKALKTEKQFVLDDGSNNTLTTDMTDKLLALLLKALSKDSIAKKASEAYREVYQPKIEAEIGFLITPDTNSGLTERVQKILQEAGFTQEALNQFTFVLFWNKGYTLSNNRVMSANNYCSISFYPTISYRDAGYSYNLPLKRDDFVLPKATEKTISLTIQMYVNDKLIYSNKHYEREVQKAEKQQAVEIEKQQATAVHQQQVQKQAQSAGVSGYCVSILLDTGWYEVQTIAKTPKNAIERVCAEYGLGFKDIQSSDESYYNVTTWLVNGKQKSQQFYIVEW